MRIAAFALFAAGAVAAACSNTVTVIAGSGGAAHGTSASASTSTVSNHASSTGPCADGPCDAVVVSAPSGPTVTSTSSGPSGCYDPSGVDVLNGSVTQVAHQSVCSKAQIAGFFSACLSASATQQKCDTWVKDAANMACQTCMLGGMGDSHVPALLTVQNPNDPSQAYVLPSKLACEAIVEGKASC